MKTSGPFSCRCLTVSCAAERSTSTTPVILPCSKPSSVCCVRFNTWPVQDLPGGNLLLRNEALFNDGGETIPVAHTACRDGRVARLI